MKDNASYCIECPSNAECPGKDIIKVFPGYWRSSNESNQIIKCRNRDACLGGPVASPLL